jgi:hypothetical protein
MVENKKVDDSISIIQYPLINNGKKFYAEKWTYRKHLEVQDELKKFEKNLDKDEKDRKFENLVILRGLKDIDSSFTEDKILDMHPNDRTSLFLAIYMSGSKGVRGENFRQQKKTPKILKE